MWSKIKITDKDVKNILEINDLEIQTKPLLLVYLFINLFNFLLRIYMYIYSKFSFGIFWLLFFPFKTILASLFF